MLKLHTPGFHCVFDQATGFLRQLKVGRVEVVRAIYAAVRDRNWLTVPVRFGDFQVRTDEQGFELRFEAECREREIHFQWQTAIRGQRDTLEFIFDGQARSAFLRNRIGLCILHPPGECAGGECQVRSTDGTWQARRFPRFIAPHQPFEQVQAMIWTPAAGLRAEVHFAGEVFETEDQRNWSDDSFKTYGTPLGLPFPVEVRPGDAVKQTVVLRLHRAPEWQPGEVPAVPTVRITDEPSVAKPAIGFGVPTHGLPTTPDESRLLRLTDAAHLRVDLHLGEPRWQADWQHARTEAAAIGATLHCALFLSDDAAAELEQFATVARDAAGLVSRCLIFHRAQPATPAGYLALAADKLARLGSPIATGTNANFAEYNRACPLEGNLACFSLNPQVHASDDLSLMENLAAQPAMVASARWLGAQSVMLSPITLRPRFNAVATAEPGEDAGATPPGADPRQATLFGAAWTLGCLARLAPLAGVDSLTFYETTGRRGVVQPGESSGQRAPYVPETVAVFPTFHVFADLADGDRLLPTHSSVPQQLAALGMLTADGRKRLLLANLQPGEQPVRILSTALRAELRRLNEGNAARASAAPRAYRAEPGELIHSSEGCFGLPVGPYEILRVDFA